MAVRGGAGDVARGGKRGHLQSDRSIVGIYETYSKRLEKRERAGQADAYQYNDLPQGLRVQLALIWCE